MAQASEKAASVYVRTSDGLAAEIERLIEASLDAMGYRIVRVTLTGNQRRVLQIMVERLGDGGMSVDDCSDVSRAVSAILDVEDPIKGAYTLEVSSPGIDRPLTRAEDFKRFAGFEAKIELQQPIEGQRRFVGRLLGLEGDRVFIRTETEDLGLPLAEVAKAKLRLTDDLIAAHQAQCGD